MGKASIRMTFLGGAGTVTGSKYLLDTPAGRFLIGCGLFQGLKRLCLMNWDRFPVDPASIDAVILTHAHLDHSGYLPLLVRNGFRGPVYCTAATRDLCGILLPDSGFLQERDAEFANRHSFSKHHPALPLYIKEDAEKSLAYQALQPFGRDVRLGDDSHVRFPPAGHILGAVIIEFVSAGMRLVFSGDLGRSGNEILRDPATVRAADFIVVESTYGDGIHDRERPEDVLADIVKTTVSRGGTVLVPTFAVGRVQTVLYHLLRLKLADRIPDIPVFLDSPMATDASKIFCAHLGEHRLTEDQCKALCGIAHYVNSVEESKALDRNQVPKIILAASGMATGGRILHHLKVIAPDPANTILFTGFQAAGTRGAAIDWLMTVDPHLHRHGGLDEICPVPTSVVHAASQIAIWIRENVRAPITIGPDSESTQWVSAVARDADAPVVILRKRRLGDCRVEISDLPEARISARTPVLVDDIVSTARTMVETVKRLRTHGARRPYCIAVHGIFAEDAYRDLRRAGARMIVSSNTVIHPSNAIDVTDLLTDQVRERLKNSRLKRRRLGRDVLFSAGSEHQERRS